MWISARNWSTFVCQIALPTAFFVIGLGYLDLDFLFDEQPSLQIDQNLLPNDAYALINKYNSTWCYYLQDHDRCPEGIFHSHNDSIYDDGVIFKEADAWAEQW